MDVFESILQGLWQTRPPGVSGSKIQRLTQIAVQNVKMVHTMWIQRDDGNALNGLYDLLLSKGCHITLEFECKNGYERVNDARKDSGKMAMLLYKHFKKTPGTHKLGVLYVLDSVARAYQDLARGEDAVPEDGTFAGGLQQLTQLLESLMNDMMLYAPAEHREKVRKLVNIWEKAATFPSGLLLRLRSTHFAEVLQTTSIESSGPVGTIADQRESSMEQKSQLISSSNASMNSCLSSMPVTLAVQVLTQMAQKMQTESQTGHLTGQPTGQPTTSPSIGTGDILPGSTNTSTVFNNTGFVNNISGVTASLADSRTASNQGLASSAQLPPDTLQAQQIALLQLLSQQGVSVAQIQSIIQHVQSKFLNEVSSTPSTFNNTQTIPGSTPPILSTLDKMPACVVETPPISQHSSSMIQNPTTLQHTLVYNQHLAVPTSHSSSARDSQGGVSGGIPSEPLTDSQVPGLSRPSLRQRDSRESLSRLIRPLEDRGKSKGVSRQRNQRSVSPLATRIHLGASTTHTAPPGSYDRVSTDVVSSSESLYALPQQSCSLKCYLRDPSVAEDSIKGSISQEKLQNMFSYYGDVQSCILNYAARHAFIKMYRRKDAEAARAGLETYVYGDTIIRVRTKWGVGFGPRDCSNYTTGVSVIPIRRLTEVDRRWCIYAEWGGTGGLPLQGGFVMEEPDIEVGTVINSKATNKRSSQNRNEHKDTTNQKQQKQQLSQSSQLQQNCHPTEQYASQSPYTLVSPWVGAIQAQTFYAFFALYLFGSTNGLRDKNKWEADMFTFIIKV
ncbi:hypothetical protein PCK2_000533 [Pneumocystis canis]|nr:hypothetical protein PCK2_000533 [Pneumocystis canis]